MPDWLFILVNICVAAFVGGITNHFAIKMLFHPRSEIRLRGRRLPFTPGLIPKRKEEIAESLGQVVSDYLVTSEGLQEMVRKPEFRIKAETAIRRRLKELAAGDLTLRDAALKIWSAGEWDSLKERAAGASKTFASRKMASLWAEYGMQDKPLKALVPGWSADKRAEWGAAGADLVARELAETLLSSDGQRMLKVMASAMIDKAGGFFGTMAAIFVDEDKLVQKLTPVLIGQLEGERVRATIAELIAGKLEEYGELPFSRLLQAAAGEPALDCVVRKLEETVPWEEWIIRLENARIADWLEPRLPELEEAVPGWVDKGLQLLENAVPSAVKAVNLPSLVQEQVQKFPVERLEQVILSVSGREFRAITWLGVLLGGMIGLFQSMITLIWR